MGALPPSNKNCPHSKLPSLKMFQLSLPSSRIFYPSPHSPKDLFKLPSTGELETKKNNFSLVFFLKFSTLPQHSVLNRGDRG